MAKKIAFTRRATKPIIESRKKVKEYYYNTHEARLIYKRKKSKEKYPKEKKELIRKLLNNEGDMVIKRFNCIMTKCIHFSECKIANNPYNDKKKFKPNLKFITTESMFSHIKVECKSHKKER